MEQAEDVIARAGLMLVGAYELDDLETAIGLLRRVTQRAPAPGHAGGPAEHGARLLASALQARYDVTGAPADLEACNRQLTELLADLPDEHPFRHEAEAWLGLNLVHGRDTDRALLLLGRALQGLAQLPEETAGRVLWRVGRLLFARSQGRHSRDLDEAVRLLGQAVVRLPDQAAPLGDLSDALEAKWRHGDRAALDRLILVRRSLGAPDGDAPDLPLALALADRHHLTGSAEDRDEALGLLVGSGLPDTALLVRARLLSARALHSAGSDLNTALALLAGLAESRTLSEAELGEVHRYLETLQELCGPHPGREPDRALQLALALAESEPTYAPTPMPASTQDPEAEAGELLRGLAMVARGEDAGLAEVERAVAEIPTGHRLRGALVAVLGTRLAWRADVLGDLEALDGADRYLAEAVRHQPESTRLRVLFAANKVIMARHRSLPQVVDEAIRELDSELATLSSADPWFPRALWVLGDAWVLRGRLRDLPAAVVRGHELVIEALAETTAHHPDHERLRLAADRALAELQGRPGQSRGPERSVSGRAPDGPAGG